MEVPTRQAQNPCHRLECSCGHQHAPELPSAVCKAVCTATQQHGPQMWDLLVWKGAHPQSPVSVSAKPRYFAELDLPATVHNLLEGCPEFWASPEFEQPLQDIAALVPDWVQQVPPASPGMPVCWSHPSLQQARLPLGWHRGSCVLAQVPVCCSLCCTVVSL